MAGLQVLQPHSLVFSVPAARPFFSDLRPARPSPRVGDSRGCCPAPVCDARGPKEPPAGADPGPRGASGTRGAPPPTCPSLLPRSQQGSYYVCKAHFERGTKICLFCKTQPWRARKFRGAVLWLPSSAPLGCRGEGPSVVSARLRCAPTAAETPPGTYLRGGGEYPIRR